MSSSFNKYYYDQFTKKTLIRDEWSEDDTRTKLQIASESVVALLDHLDEDDQFGMVLFDDKAYLMKKITSVKEIDMDALKREILDISPDGGTNLERGYAKATSLFDQYPEFNEQEYENRIIFLTDAMLNLGSTRSQDLLESTEQNAGKKVYSTFIGVGVDFNTELIEYITKIRGANYYSVHSSREFKSRMDD